MPKRRRFGTFLSSKFALITQSRVRIALFSLGALILVPSAGYALGVFNSNSTQVIIPSIGQTLSAADEVTPPDDQQETSPPAVTTSTQTTGTGVTVNGEAVNVPENGSVHKVIKNADGETVVDISVNNSSGTTGSSTSSYSSYSDVQVYSSSDQTGGD